MQCTFKLLPLKTETRLIQTIQMRYKTRYQIYCKRNPLKLLFGIYRGVIFVQALILVLQHIAYVIYKSIIYLLTVSCITIKTGNFVHIYYFRHWAQKLGPFFYAAFLPLTIRTTDGAPASTHGFTDQTCRVQKCIEFFGQLVSSHTFLSARPVSKVSHSKIWQAIYWRFPHHDKACFALIFCSLGR